MDLARASSRASMVTFATRAESITTAFEKLALEEPSPDSLHLKREAEDLIPAFQAILSGTRATDVDQARGLRLVQHAVQKRLSREWVLNLRDRDAVCILDLLQDWLDVEPFHPMRQRVILLLVKLAAASEQLPTTLFLHGVDLGGLRDPEFMGGFADVFRARYRGQEVAVKRLRVSSNSEKAVLYRKFCREALIWRQLRHDHVLPFLGVDRDNFALTKHLCMVALWMLNGTVRDFLKTDAYVPKLLCNRLLLESASGLFYLHSQDVIHGDVNDVNILVDADYHARIADFGLTLVGESSVVGMTTSESGAGTLRWKAPEFHNEDSRRSFAGDVWAFACLCLVLYTKDRPYGGISDGSAVRQIMAGRHPKRPSPERCHGLPLPDDMWSLLLQCWAFEPSTRPSMSDILEHFKRFDVNDSSSNSPSVVTSFSDESKTLVYSSTAEEELSFTSTTLSYISPPPYELPMQGQSASHSEEELIALGMTTKVLGSIRNHKADDSEPVDNELVSRGMTRSVSNAARHSGALRAPRNKRFPSSSLPASSPVPSQPKEKRAFFYIALSWGKRKEEANSEIYRMIGYLIATGLLDWNLVERVCTMVAHSDAHAKAAIMALQNEFKYGEASGQLSAGRLWAIMIKNCPPRFLSYCSSASLLSVIYGLLVSQRTPPVVRERIYTVLAGAVAIIQETRGLNLTSPSEPSPLQTLWFRVKSPHHFNGGIDFDYKDEMFKKTVPFRHKAQNSTQGPEALSEYSEVPSMQEEGQKAIAPELDFDFRKVRNLFEECKVGKENASALEEALSPPFTFGIHGGDIKLQGYIARCRISEESISSQIVWVTDRVQRLHEQRSANSTLHIDGSSFTDEERLLNKMLDTAKLLQELLSVAEMQLESAKEAQEHTQTATFLPGFTADSPLFLSTALSPNTSLHMADSPSSGYYRVRSDTFMSAQPGQLSKNLGVINEDLWYASGYKIMAENKENVLLFGHSKIDWSLSTSGYHSPGQAERIESLLSGTLRVEYPEDLDVALRYAMLLSGNLTPDGAKDGIEYSHSNVAIILNFCWRALHSIPGRIYRTRDWRASSLYKVQRELISELQQVHAKIDEFDAKMNKTEKMSSLAEGDLWQTNPNLLGSPGHKHVEALSAACSKGVAHSHELLRMLDTRAGSKLIPVGVMALLEACQGHQELIHSQLPLIAREVALVKRFEVTNEAQEYKTKLIQLLDDMTSANEALLDTIMLYDDHERAWLSA